jgi:hypothetical protein
MALAQLPKSSDIDISRRHAIDHAVDHLAEACFGVGDKPPL